MGITAHHLPTDEAALLQDCRAGKAAAQRTLYGLYAGPMMVVCSRYLPLREDAQEALTDAFVSFFKNLARFEYRGEGSTAAWLKKIVVNTCLMRLRKARSEPWMLSVETVVTDEPALDADVAARISAREIMKLVQALPDGYRTVFNLYAFEEMSHAEIAATLGISESTSKTQLFKARRALQAALRAHKIIEL